MITATVQRQYWDNNYAHDAAPPEKFDVASLVEGMALSERLAIADNSAESDDLFLAAVESGTVRAWDGPFYVTVADAILQDALMRSPFETLTCIAHSRGVTLLALTDAILASVGPGPHPEGLRERVDTLMAVATPARVAAALERL